MPAKLDHNELTLLVLLGELLDDGKELEIGALRVLVASHGQELGRSYFRLSQKGFVHERDIQPSFLKRLAGARRQRKVTLTSLATEYLAARASEGDSATKKTKDADASSLATTAPVKKVTPQVEEQRKPTAQPSVRRFAPTDYTETLGGVPLESAELPSDFDMLAGITELLSLLGFEITPAGTLLAEKRAEANVSEAEITLEVLVASVAHAARLGLMGTVRISTGPALARIAEIQKAFSFLVSEGAFEEHRLGEAIALMREFASLKGSSHKLDDYLADPIRGLAPPSVCPDDMFEIINVDDE